MGNAHSRRTVSQGTESDNSSDRTSLNTTASSSISPGEEPREMSYSLSSISISDQIGTGSVCEALSKIASDFDIHPDKAAYLKQLTKFKIVFIFDDSGSMNTPLHGRDDTRWNQLHQFAIILLKVAIIFNPQGVDIYFLNREAILNVHDVAQLDQIFSECPKGHTPLAKVLETVFELPEAQPENNKKLLVFIATDGIPTDDNGNENVHDVERLMRESRHTETTYVQFLICTDEPKHMEYLYRWDQSMVNVDVTSSFFAERSKIRQYHGYDYPFSMGDYMVKGLVGAIISDIDNLNEPTAWNLRLFASAQTIFFCCPWIENHC